MWEAGNGREALPTRRDAYATGERVFGAIDGMPGTVVSVGEPAGTVTVEWIVAEVSVGNVVYPDDTIMIRKAWPWE